MTQRSLSIALSIFVLGLGACHRAAPKTPEGFALAFIDAARAGKVGPEWVDDALVERIRRVERLQMVAKARAPAEVIAKVWASAPDPKLAAADRGQVQRERAAQALSHSLHGQCTAKSDAMGAIGRLNALASPLDKAPPDAQAELASLHTALTGSSLVRVHCDQGAVGLLLVPRRVGFWQVVDLFAVNENRAPIKLPPAQPSP